MCGQCWGSDGKYLHGPKAPDTLSGFMRRNGFLTIDQIRVDTYSEVTEYIDVLLWLEYPTSMTN